MSKYVFDDEAIKAGLAKLSFFELLESKPDLTDSEAKVVGILEKVSDILDNVFMEQICPATLDIVKELEAKNESERLDFVYFNKSPWNVLDNLKPFVSGTGVCSDIGVYPEGLTQQELESAIADGTIDADSARSYYTAIRRKQGKLEAIPYSEEYRSKLKEASLLLEEAAMAADNQSLRAYLKATSEALISNDYSMQQELWLALDSRIEPTIGPYETYEDRKFGYKGFFESYISILESKETDKLKSFASHLGKIDATIPIEDGLKFKRKDQSRSPIVVVNEIYFGGEANAGFVTSAFNLPNDEKVRAVHGSKKVLMKNIIAMKFERLSKPIAERILDTSQMKFLSQDAALYFVLFHELSHGLGASEVETKNGFEPVAIRLKELFSHIEEARADVTGVYCAMYFNRFGMMEGIDMKEFYVSYFTTNLLRGMRMGLKEAHAMGQAIEYNYLKENGGISYDQNTGRFGIEMAGIENAMMKLVKELNTIEASGDYERAKKLTEKYCYYPKELENAYESIEDLPIEIMPIRKKVK
jgi:hypothetical protein